MTKQRRRLSGVRAGAVVLLAALLVVCIAVPVDYAVLDSRIARADVSLSEGAGETWVIVGSDSRSELPDGRNVYGTTSDSPGQRADVILVVHKQGDTTHVLSLPRDLVTYDSATASFERLALRWLDGPDAFVRSLCGSLGVNVSHLIVVTMADFAAIIDAVGGVEVDIPHPVTDAKAGLDLKRAGTHVLDGRTALALVRSRHAAQRIDGAWVPSTVTSGSASRTAWAGRILTATISAARAQLVNPVAAQRIALSATDHITADRDTSLLDVLRAWPGSAPIVDVPGQSSPGMIPLQVTEATLSTLAAAGFEPGQCRVSTSNGR